MSSQEINGIKMFVDFVLGITGLYFRWLIVELWIRKFNSLYKDDVIRVIFVTIVYNILFKEYVFDYPIGIGMLVYTSVFLSVTAIWSYFKIN